MTSHATSACWQAETQTAADLDFLDALASRGLLTASQVRAIHRQLGEDQGVVYPRQDLINPACRAFM